MIAIENYSKTFHLKSGDVKALDNVCLHINDGDIYGVIGYSGAGKSTLVRCINFLEIPDSGSLSIDGFGKIDIKNGILYKDDKRIDEKSLNEMRRGIGMIFQHFNLLDRSTVFENIAFPLKGMEKKAISDKVFAMLDLVGLTDKAYVYPSQLSGGQKQRVAIARALVSNPGILLSDEATSALDPEATESILNLLSELNRKLGLTIVIITHEMAVIKSICNRVAVMEEGRVVEEGNVYNVFADPKQNITRKFIDSASSLSKIDNLIKKESKVVAVKKHEKLCKLVFKKSVDRPVISEISRIFNVDCNIVLANVEVIGNNTLGAMIIKFGGKKEDVDAAGEYLSGHGIKVEVLA